MISSLLTSKARNHLIPCIVAFMVMRTAEEISSHRDASRSDGEMALNRHHEACFPCRLPLEASRDFDNDRLRELSPKQRAHFGDRVATEPDSRVGIVSTSRGRSFQTVSVPSMCEKNDILRETQFDYGVVFVVLL